MENKAVYPGSFDPITNGHVDIINRGLKVFNKILVAVLENPKKTPLFTTKERISMIKESFSNQKNVEVKAFKGLLVEFAKKNEAKIVIRGLRAVSDFEYEFQMALMNRQLSEDITTVFLMPHEKFTYLNSTIIKNVANFGGDIEKFVTKFVEQKLIEKLSEKGTKNGLY